MRTFVLIIFIFILNSCISTYIKSFTDPGYKYHPVEKIMVYVSNLPYDYRELLENLIVEKFTENAIYAIPSYPLFPPTRTYNEENIEKIIFSNGNSTVLMVQLADENSGTKILSVNRHRIQNSIYTIPVGYDYRVTWFNAALLVKGIEHPIWISQAETRADGLVYTGIKTSFIDYSNKLVEELLKRGPILPN